MNRREFLTSSLVGSTGLASQAQAAENNSKIILGIACSPRAGKTTATGVGIALEAAAKLDAGIKTELIDLGGKDIAGWNGTGQFPADDFINRVLVKLRDPALAGLIIGSPVYFRNMSSRCMSLLERLAALRKPKLLLASKVVGALSVGGYRHGGQELVIQQIQTAMLCHEVMLVGGKPGAHQGATLWNSHKDDIGQDTFGVETARQLGTRVGEAVLALA